MENHKFIIYCKYIGQYNWLECIYLITFATCISHPSQKNSVIFSILAALVLVWIQNAFAFVNGLPFLCGSCALFTGFTSTDFSKFFFTTGSHGTIHTFKNYFATVFLVFSNKQYPNRLINTSLHVPWQHLIYTEALFKLFTT